MRQGILKILCVHAHSADPNMRVSSLWALKHLANAAPNDVKMSIIEELGTGWLIHSMAVVAVELLSLWETHAVG